MSLPLPKLDDKTFEELVEEAGKLIPTYTAKWTDLNPHDPGITFLELFAWLAETQMYRLNRVTDRHLLKFLTILRNRPLPASPAKVDLLFSSDDAVFVPRQTLIKSESGDIIFATDDDIVVLPLVLKAVVGYSNYQFRDVTDFNNTGKTYYYAFGEEPDREDALYIGFDAERDCTGKEVRLGIHLFEGDLPRAGSHDGEAMEVFPSANVSWEYCDGTAWRGLSVSAPLKTILAMTQGGTLSFVFPHDMKKSAPAGLSEDLYWIRCRVTEAGFEIPPRVDRILINVVSATQALPVSEGIANPGMPDQRINTSYFPVVPDSHQVLINNEQWTPVNDLDASLPEDRHYAVNLSSGQILFGDGTHGSVPEKSSAPEISLRYSWCKGLSGNVGAETLNISGLPGLNVSNPFPASGGRDAESIGEAFVRFRKDLRIPYAAVTLEDFEYLANSTPGLRVARAKAIADADRENTITVCVVPYGLSGRPEPGRGFLRTVCNHLDMHRLITTYVRVIGPDYVDISLNAYVSLKPESSPDAVRAACSRILTAFLSPVTRYAGDLAWPFGRPVYRSEIYQILEKVDGIDCISGLTLSAAGGVFRVKNGDILIGDLSLVCPGRFNIEISGRQQICRLGVM